jgi:DNA-binding transcriptional ArsR family regulator
VKSSQKRPAGGPQAFGRESGCGPRAKVILLCADGITNREVARRTDLSEHTVGTWRKRFLETRMAGLIDLPRSGRPRSISDEKVAEIINDMIRRGSFRSVGELKSSIQRYLDAHNADPKPFRWTATPEAILSKVENICKTLS